MRMLKNLMQERRATPRKELSDFFDYVLEELKKEGTILTEAIALDLMFVLLFASFETTSLALTLAIKFLSDHPRVLKQLTVSKILPFWFHCISLPTALKCWQTFPKSLCLWQEEHEAILRNRDDASSGLSWKEYKLMTYTFQVGYNRLNYQVEIIRASVRL